MSDEKSKASAAVTLSGKFDVEQLKALVGSTGSSAVVRLRGKAEHIMEALQTLGAATTGVSAVVFLKGTQS